VAQTRPGDLSRVSHAEHVMGTVVSFAVLPAAPARGGPHRRRPDPATAIQAACALLHQADAVFSTRDPQSPLSRLRRGDLAEADGPACLAEVPMACEAAREASGGWFDPWAMPGGYDPTGLVKGWAVDQRPPVRRSMIQFAGPGSRPVIPGRDPGPRTPAAGPPRPE
jgi:FAD:protein FMN transferase